MFKFNGFGSGFLVGAAVGFVSRDLLASEKSYVRPFVKGTMKSGTSAWGKGLELLSHLTETLEDIMAEIRSESKESDHKARAEPTELRRKKRANAKT
jgi:hypothetical protein